MNVNSKGEILSSSDNNTSNRNGSEESDSDGKYLKSLKSLPQSSSSPKLVIHLQTSNKHNPRLHQEEDDDDESSAARPWNLRTRRAVCKSPNESGNSKINKPPPPPPQQPQQQNCVIKKPKYPSPKSLRLRGLAAMAANQAMAGNQGGLEKKRREFSRSLSREEIKQDFLAITGTNPARRPRKRAKIVQKQINNLLLGFWLTEVTADSYKVADELVETMKK